MSPAQLEAPAALHVDGAVMEASIGALQAQHVIESIEAGTLAPSHAWLAFAELAIAHGWRSAACRAVVVELAKRLRPPEG